MPRVLNAIFCCPVCMLRSHNCLDISPWLLKCQKETLTFCLLWIKQWRWPWTTSQVPQPTYFSGATEQLSSGPPGTSGPLGPQGKILLYLLWSKNNSETAYLIYWWVQIVAKLTVCLYQIASTHDELESFPGSTILPILASQQCQFRSLCTKRGWSKNTLQWALLLSPFY